MNTPSNKPNSWPPEPQTSEPGKIKEPENTRAGGLSLGLALVAILGVLPLPFLIARSADINLQRLYVLGYMVWWAVAVVAGIIGRRSTSGKIALAILVLLGIVCVWLGHQPPPPRYR